MTDSQIPVAGSLSAKVIRACPKHPACDLDCPERVVEDLGEIASFDNQHVLQKIKETLWRRSAPTPEKPS